MIFCKVANGIWWHLPSGKRFICWVLCIYYLNLRQCCCCFFSVRITPRRYDIVDNTTARNSNKSVCDSDRLKEPKGSSQESTSTEGARAGTTLFERQTRISLTLRKIRHVPCKCGFWAQCDSQAKNTSAPQVPLSSDVPKSQVEAEKLEKLHVHEVYENIATHFSGTRHSPWPRIAKFLRDQPAGTIVADVGCGNGKYFCLLYTSPSPRDA